MPQSAGRHEAPECNSVFLLTCKRSLDTRLHPIHAPIRRLSPGVDPCDLDGILWNPGVPRRCMYGTQA